MDPIVDDFSVYIASEKGLSPHSVEAYQRDVQCFIAYLAQLSIHSITDVKQGDIISYLGKMQQEGYASASISRALIALKVFFRFLKREGLINQNIALYMDSPKLWQIIPDVLSLNEVERLLEQPNTQTMLGSRDKAILEVLYGSGLRVSEVCQLGIYDVDDAFVRVIGKGRKERLVPCGSKAIAAIDDYLTRFRCQYDSEKMLTLFLSNKGKPIDRVTVWKRIKEYVHQAKIRKNIFPHTLRHTFATHLLDNGADLRIIQEMLGHGHISSTDRYMHVGNARLHEVFDRFHPRK